MIFSRLKIKESLENREITILPFSEENLRDASYILHLDLRSYINLPPQGFTTVKTIEKITLSSKVACFISTHGDIAGQGIDIAQSSLFCEPSTNNQITLEISNASQQPVRLEPGMKVAKAIFVSVI